MTGLRKEFRANWAADLARQAGLRRPEPWKKRGADLVVHYVLGASPGTAKARPSPFIRAQAHALDIPWRFQEIYDWFPPARGTRTVLQPLGWAP